MNVPSDLLYADTHEWLRITDGIGTVGITDHAQAELTDIVFVENPKVGAGVMAGQPVAVVESVKAASDIYAPVEGEVVEINEAVAAHPALVNTDPYGEGWLFKIRVSDAADLSVLKSPEEYTAKIAS